MGVVARDARHALRALRAAPGFTAATILMMGLGVGATTALFSLTYAVLFRPLPWSEPDRVVRLQETRGGRAGRVPWTITNTTYHAWRVSPATIEEIGGWMRTQAMTMTTGTDGGERVRVGQITPSLLRVLGVQPAIGRRLEDTDVSRDGPRAVLLGHSLWRTRFGGDPAAVGRGLRLDDRTVTIAGVMGQDFTFPDRDAQLWMPLGIATVESGATVIRAMIFNAVARLKPGVTAAQASSEGTARGRAAPSLGSAAVALFGSGSDVALAAIPAREALTGDVRPALVVLLASVALIFATAIASVVVLQAARAVKRRRDVAVRMAIGASSRDLARAWLVESGLLGAAGALFGLAVAAGIHRILPSILPPDFPRLHEVTLDGAVTLFAVLIAMLAVVVCGLAPAIQVRPRNLVESLTAGVAGSSGPIGGAAPTLRRVMMVAQVAIACLLLVGTALLTRSFAALLVADRGYDPDGVLTAHVTIRPQPFAAQAPALERVRERLQALPGVTVAGFANALPFVTTGGFRGFSMPSPSDPAAKVEVQTLIRTVSPDYFPALRLRLLAGRTLDSSDGATSRPSVVVNRTFAKQYLGANPIGVIVPVQFGSLRDFEVVGVVDDVRQGGLGGVAPAAFGGVADPAQPEMFFTPTQWTSPVSDLIFVVRGGSGSSLASSLRTILREEDPSLVIDSIMTMEERVMHSLARPRTYAVLLGGFAVFAVGVAAAGLFGVMSYMAAQRTREIGIRTALGATPRDIVRLITGQAAAILAGGVAIGLGAAFILTRAIAPLLYGVPAHDPVSFVAVPFALAAVVGLACAWPARNATRVSPLVALRHQ
jgi:putative ABC transport system permease protein